MVVGLPYNMDGSAGPMAKKYAAEAKVLGDTLRCLSFSTMSG